MLQAFQDRKQPRYRDAIAREAGGQACVLRAQADDVGSDLHLIPLQRFDARRRRHQPVLQRLGLARECDADVLGGYDFGLVLGDFFLQSPELVRRGWQSGQRLGGNRTAQIGHPVLRRRCGTSGRGPWTRHRRLVRCGKRCSASDKERGKNVLQPHLLAPLCSNVTPSSSGP